MSDYDVVVIGAGCGGLGIGALLSHQGRKVLVVEQSNLIGGCCSTFEQKGYRIDLGASIIEFPQVIDWCFKRMGTSFFDEVDLVPVDPTFSAMLSDGTKVTYPLSLEETRKEIMRVAPEDVKGWDKYSKKFQGFIDTALDGFFVSPMNNFTDMVKLFAKTPALLKYNSLFFSSYEGVIRKYFKNEKIIESFSFHSFYAGQPPALLPGHFAMLPYAEHAGVYYSKGGMIGIPKGFQKCGEKSGMKIRLNTAVKKILVSKKRVRGVVLEDGTEITSDVVVSNINSRKMYLEMIGEEHLPWLAKAGLKSYTYSMATPMLYLCLNYTPPLEHHHTLMTLPMEKVNNYWFNHYLKGSFPKEQFGILSWTTRSDPSLAPKGHHIIAVTLAPGVYKLKGTTWDQEKPRLKEEIINYLDKTYLPGLKEHIVLAELSTPSDFEKRLRSPEGAIYALRQDLPHSMMFRPAAKSKHVKGLYLVGASTHPGGGVPTVIASAMIGADLIEKYEQ
ncbi:MAG: phytoene desaturase [Spirochaetes bacterium]|nr:phytoene desaturase [Spirochaetota bacterium]